MAKILILLVYFVVLTSLEAFLLLKNFLKIVSFVDPNLFGRVIVVPILAQKH